VVAEVIIGQWQLEVGENYTEVVRVMPFSMLPSQLIIDLLPPGALLNSPVPSNMGLWTPILQSLSHSQPPSIFTNRDLQE
jgi:hypothetical protein